MSNNACLTETLDPKPLDAAGQRERLAIANLELQLTNAALEDQLQQTRAIIECAAEGIMTFDASGMILSFNAAAARIFELPVDDAIGRKIWQLIPAVTLKDGEDMPAASPREKQSAGEFFGIRHGDERFPVDLAISQLELAGCCTCTAIVRDLTRRKHLERQLSHAQKMESVGQLAAGVAHEINTPIQYVGDNLKFLEDTFQDLWQLLNAYQTLHSAARDGHDLGPGLSAVDGAAQSCDLDFLLEEVPSAIAQSLEGTERVAKIVRAMKEFSHTEPTQKSLLDIHHAIENTLTVSRNQWKHVAEVVTKFDSTLPLIPCLPAEFNHALLNLVVNAAHAIREREEQGMGTITIQTQVDGDWAVIRIADTGGGIPREIRNKIFDPFFTTKPVGVGTGQGLSITYSAIVEKHKGTIDFETELGKGTTFVIRLPLDAV